MRYVMFSKHLQSLDVAAMGRAVKDIGLDGVELTVRPGGHVRPERVTEDLPRAVRRLHGMGLEVPAITTEVQGAGATHAHDVCAAAAKAGIRILRNTSWHYCPFGDIREQIAAAAQKARALEALGRDHGVRLCVHCHIGEYLTAQGAVLAQIIEATDPRYVGVSFDLSQLTVEGGLGGWMLSLDLLWERIGMLAVTGYGWFTEPDPETGGTRWTPKCVPLADGVARWAKAFTLLRQTAWDSDGDAVVSLLSEYQGTGSWRDLTVPELLTQTAADLTYLRRQAAVAR